MSAACSNDCNSTEIFQQTKQRLEDERKRRAALEAQLKVVHDDLQKSQNECGSPEGLFEIAVQGHADLLTVSLIDTDKLQAARMVKEQQSAELTKIQNENEALKRRTIDLETDRVGLETLLKDNLNAKRNDNDTITNKSVLELFEEIKRSAQKPKFQDKKELEKSIENLENMILEGNAKVAKQEEVQTKNTKSPQNVSSTNLPQPSPSTHVQHQAHKQQQQPPSDTNPDRRSLGNKLSTLFRSSNADNKQTNAATPKTERRASKDATISGFPSPTRQAYSSEDFRHLHK